MSYIPWFRNIPLHMIHMNNDVWNTSDLAWTLQSKEDWLNLLCFSLKCISNARLVLLFISICSLPAITYCINAVFVIHVFWCFSVYFTIVYLRNQTFSSSQHYNLPLSYRWLYLVYISFLLRSHIHGIVYSCQALPATVTSVDVDAFYLSLYNPWRSAILLPDYPKADFSIILLLASLTFTGLEGHIRSSLVKGLEGHICPSVVTSW